MLDADQKSLMAAVINASYGDVIMRTLAKLLILDMQKIEHRLKVQKNDFDMDTIKRELLILCAIRVKHEDEIIDELLTQYGLKQHKDEIDFYHQEMSVLVRKHSQTLMELIGQGDLRGIIKLSQHQN